MVTAIIIPIICLYFFWLTRKEMKEQEVKWLAAGDVRQEAVVTGTVKNVVLEKQRFYYNRLLYVQTIMLQTDSKLICAQKITPITTNRKLDTFTVGDTIRIYGSWKENKFLFSFFEVEKR